MWDSPRGLRRTALGVLGVGALLGLCYVLQIVVLILVFAMFFAYLLAPAVDGLGYPVRLGKRQLELSRGVRCALVYVGLACLGVVGASAFLPLLSSQLEQLATSAPEYLSVTRQALTLDPSRLPEPLRATMLDAIALMSQKANSELENSVVELAAAARFLPLLVLVPVVTFFLLKDAELFRQSALRLLPQGRARWRAGDFFSDAHRALANYVRAQLLACLLMGTACSIGYAAIGMPYALVVGSYAGFAELIPLLGPFSAALLAGLVATLGPDGTFLSVALYLAVLRVGQDFVLYPRLVGNGVNLHPLVVILAIICGSQLFGLAGLFLAIPLTVIMTVAYRHFSPADEAAARPALRPDNLGAMSGAKLAGMRVLVVDNEPDALALVSRVLEDAGAEVATASSAAEAVSCLIDLTPDVLISDIGMPQGDGFELIRHVRALENPAQRTVPAIALTGFAMPEDRRRALLAGFQAHVPKPVDAQTLVEVVALAARAPEQVAPSPLD